MHGTATGKDIFEEVSKCVNELKLPWDKLTGLTTDGAPVIRGEKNGLVGGCGRRCSGRTVPVI